jgi:hypothetical protein
VLSSISGQNEPWARIGAHRPPPLPPSGQSGGWGSTNGATSSSGTAASSPATGGTSPALSDSMSFALLAFANSGASKTAGSGAATPAQQSSGQQAGGGTQSQLFSDLQSLIGTLTGSAGPKSAGTTASGPDVGSPGLKEAGPSLDASLSKELQALSSDLNSITSGSSRQTAARSVHRSEGNETSHPATTTGGWNPDHGDRFQRQLAVNAYSANVTPSPNSSSSSALTSITA